MEIFEVRDSRDGFLWIPNSLFDYALKTLKPSSLFVYLALARMANNVTQQCFPSYERLADMTGLSRATVATALKDLRTHRIITWGNRDGHNVYSLLDTDSLKIGRVQSGEHNSPISEAQQSSPLDPNKTHNKTQEQDFSSPPVSSGNDLVLSSDNPVTHSSKQKKETDPRTAVVRQMLAVFWNDKNSPDELYWEAADAAQLKSFLKRWPKRSVGDIARALGNYGDSEGIVETRTPKEFLPRLHLYFEGPLNRFNHPLGAKHASA